MSSSFADGAEVLVTEAALPRWTAAEFSQQAHLSLNRRLAV